jgi:hypothetical protein
LTQNEKALDSLGLRIVLTFGYRKGGAEEAAWKTKEAPGVAASRVFIKSLTPGSYRTVEFALAPSAQGGFELATYGQQVDQAAQSLNPDLAQIQQLVNDEVARMEQAPPPPEASQLAFETYYLSYVVADRALALLKTLGYTTVEYNEQAGESIYERIYNPIKLGTGKPPIVVKLIDSTKTSLMDNVPTAPGQVAAPQVPMPQPGAAAAGLVTSAGVPQIGGTFLHQMTSGEPQERLLILYNKDDPESLQTLVNVLQGTIDVPSREIMIEALVIEINTNRLRELGVTFQNTQRQSEFTSSTLDSSTFAATAFTFAFAKGPSISDFKYQLEALLKTREAEILSNPSVLVLDDRQARIQIGQQVPVSKTLFTPGAGNVTAVDYFPVGIVLNMRPRISEDGSEITMQTETIVSAISATSTLPGTAILPAPIIDNRQVQSIVRVADNTPFIIGGLISNTDTKNVAGIPLLSQIPVFGALFRKTSVNKMRQEVIIVVTPHVVPLEDRYFSYVIPKDNEARPGTTGTFDRFNYKLFRNAYRVRGDDLFDLEFVYDSNVYKDLVSRVTAASAVDPQLTKSEPFASVLKGGAPGEDILVRRMLWETIYKTNYLNYIDPSQIIFFKNNPTAVAGSGFGLEFLTQELKKLKGVQSALALTYEAQPKGTEERPFVPPKAAVSYANFTHQNYQERLIDGNKRNPDGTPQDWELLLSTEKFIPVRGHMMSPLELLQGVLVLKRLLELNQTMPMTLKEFHIGRQIIFPSQEELKHGYHLIDREVAKLFYEVYNYYPAFEQEFNRQTRRMNARLESIHHQ